MDYVGGVENCAGHWYKYVDKQRRFNVANSEKRGAILQAGRPYGGAPEFGFRLIRLHAAGASGRFEPWKVTVPQQKTNILKSYKTNQAPCLGQQGNMQVLLVENASDIDFVDYFKISTQSNLVLNFGFVPSQVFCFSLTFVASPRVFVSWNLATIPSVLFETQRDHYGNSTQ